MCLATSSYNPAKQETSSSVADAFLRTAVPMTLLTAHGKSAKYERRKADFFALLRCLYCSFLNRALTASLVRILQTSSKSVRKF